MIIPSWIAQNQEKAKFGFFVKKGDCFKRCLFPHCWDCILQHFTLIELPNSYIRKYFPLFDEYLWECRASGPSAPIMFFADK